jgi:hypothetical protein
LQFLFKESMNLISFFPRLRPSAAKSPITLVRQISTPFAGRFFVLAAAVLCAGSSIPAASAQTVTYAGTGAVNFGSVNVCPSGKTTPAPCSQTVTLTYSVTESGTLGTPKALTYGAPDLDYIAASGSTCSGSVTKGDTCKVNVTFAPTQPGARNGAVEVVDSSGNVLASTYIYGTGIGPRISFSPAATARTINIAGSSPTFPYAGPIAVDGNGNIFIAIESADATEAYVEELLAVNGSIPANPVVKVLAVVQTQGIYTAIACLAVDGAGNLFLTADGYLDFSGPVEELLAADGFATSKIIGEGDLQFGLAVDGSGNVFVSNSVFVPNDGGNTPGALYEYLAAGGYTTVKTLAGAVQFNNNGDGPNGISLDANGNLFAGSDDDVLEFTPSDGYTTPRTINAGVNPTAIDPAGNLFGNGVEFLAVGGVLPANPAFRALAQTAQSNPITFDPRGNLYFTSESGLKQLQLTTPPTLTFAQTEVGHTSTDSPQSVQVQNEGNAPLDLSGLSLDSSNWELVPGSGTPEDCASSTSLASSALCNISISFKPTEAGSFSGAVALTDNAPGSTQSIALRGAGVIPYISSLSNTYGAPYSVVILNGINFGATQGASTVTFDGIATPHYHWSDTQIYVTVPPNAKTGNIVVTVNGKSSNDVPFTVVPQPKITGISPTSGPVGTSVTISGTNLLDLDHKGTVAFNGKLLSGILAGDTLITVTIPSGATTGSFHVLVNDTGINTAVFTVTK